MSEYASGTSVLAYKSSKHHAYVLSDTSGGRYSKKSELKSLLLVLYTLSSHLNLKRMTWAAIVPMAKTHLQLVKMQPGRDTSALLEGIRCAAATGCAVTGRRFQRSCKDRDHTHAIPWDASLAPFLLLAAILAAGEIQRDVFFSDKFLIPLDVKCGYLLNCPRQLTLA